MSQQEGQPVQPASVPQDAATAPATAVQTAAPMQPAILDGAVKHGIGRGMKVLIGVVAGLVVVGAAAAAYFVLRAPSRVAVDPEKLLFMGVEQLLQVEDVRLRLHVPGATLAELDERGNLDVGAEFGVDATTSNVTATADIVRRASAGGMNLLVEVSDDEDYVGIELRVVSEDLFLRVVDVVSEQSIPFDRDLFVNQWVHANMRDVERWFGTIDDSGVLEETFEPSDYVEFEVREYLPRIREIYRAQPPLDVSLIEERVDAGTAKIRIEANDYTDDFVRRVASELYDAYLAKVDAAIAQRAAAGEADVATGLRAYREALADEFGARGEDFVSGIDDTLLEDVWGDVDEVVDDVSVVLEVHGDSGRFASLAWEFVFKDGVQRAPITLQFSEYNTGRAIDAPAEYTELMDLIELFFGGIVAEGVDEDVDQTGDGFDNFLVDLGSDEDGDGLTLEEEYDAGTDPDAADTDGDGLDDAMELMIYFTNPLDKDSDSDGLDDGEEVTTYRTSPTNPDSDDDGYADGVEVATGHDPLK